MNRSAQQRTGAAVAGLLAVDALFHLYWATGLTWPAVDRRGLSMAVLNTEVPFTPPVVLPLAAVLLVAAGAVRMRATGVGGVTVRRVAAAVTVAVAGGLLVRGAAGVVWACGVGADPGSAFYLLNLLLYTPVCLGFGVFAARLAASRRVEDRPHVRV